MLLDICERFIPGYQDPAPGQTCSGRHDMKRNCPAKDNGCSDPVHSLWGDSRGLVIWEVIPCLSVKATPLHPSPSYSLQYWENGLYPTYPV